MIRLRGGHVVLFERTLPDGVVAIDHETIVEVGPDAGPSDSDVDCRGCWVLPGFIDGHVHGSCGSDVLGDASGVADVAAVLPRFGVTGFCPTSVACTPEALAAFLQAVDGARRAAPGAARVLGAHLESNFINPDYKGAQPAACLRLPPRPGEPDVREGVFTGAAILRVIEAHREAVRLVTLAPELDGALALVSDLAKAGHRVSLGHSAASFEVAEAAIQAGARHATHLFNRMPPLSHRAPGLAGAVLAHDELAAEVICDGVHVHPALIRAVVRAKGIDGVRAITDATSGAGLPPGATARLGATPITVTAGGAFLADGTLAGSVTTMDAVFRFLVRDVGLEVVEASRLCARSAAIALGMPAFGSLAPGFPADIVVLDQAFRVRQTWIAGRLAWNSVPSAAVSHPEEQG